MSKISIGITAYGPQPSVLTYHITHIAIEIERLGHTFGELLIEGVSNVDLNRNKIVQRFLQSDADYLWWIDADNTPPIDSLLRLLAVGKPAVSGLYYGGVVGVDPRPVAYLRRSDGAYQSLDVVYQWERGEIVPVDAVGMGCFLTHRSIYEDIEDKYEVIQALNGWSMTIHKDDIVGKVGEPQKHPYANKIKNGVLYVPVVKPSLEIPFPHFQCQFNRTEDFVFCENLKRLGYDILVDTSVEAGHWKLQAILGSDYRKQKGLVTNPEVEDK